MINPYLISHRGNVSGRDVNRENSPDYIMEAINQGYHVEIDVWYVFPNGYMLGHDDPVFPVTEAFLTHENLWIHAKTPDTLLRLLPNPKIKCFYHDTADCTIISNGKVWGFPRFSPNKNTIFYLSNPMEIHAPMYTKLYGICCDKVSFFREIFE